VEGIPGAVESAFIRDEAEEAALQGKLCENTGRWVVSFERDQYRKVAEYFQF
jgi:hypothetical protein